ncbi:hypothetical protein [Belliella pelovolcani]|uniref:hypothetical protein n=1 Tax=Belliella pelovolcani TaxID=529505 RepID=UPI00391CE93F
MKKIVSLSLILGLCGISFLFANDNPCPPIIAGESGTAGVCIDVPIINPDGTPKSEKECDPFVSGLPADCWASV